MSKVSNHALWITTLVGCAVAAVVYTLTRNELNALILGGGCLVGLLAYQMWFAPTKTTLIKKPDRSSHDG